VRKPESPARHRFDGARRIAAAGQREGAAVRA
jgi:hypothetical protein